MEKSSDKVIINPFLFGKPLQVVELSNTITEEIKNITSSAGSKTVITTEKRKINKQSFSKLYQNPVIRRKTLNLSPSALKLYNFILYTLPKNQDVIKINRDLFIEETALSVKTYNNALNELITESYIVRQLAGKYWINPHYFFCGDDIGFIIDTYGENYIEICRTVTKLKGAC